MTKARILANLISDNAELADGQISVAEVVGAAPLASPTFTGTVTTADVTMNGYLTVNGAGVDVNTTIYPNGIAMEDGRSISFGTGVDFGLSSGGTFLDFNTIGNAKHIRIINGLTEHHRFSGDGNVIFNNSGADADFRIESDNNSNMFFVNGGTDRIGIGTSNPSTFIHAQSSGDIQFRFETTSDSTAQIQYKNASNQWSAGIDNLEQFFIYDSTNAHSALTFRPLNEVVFNQNSKNVDFRIESDGNANMFFVDAGADAVCIGTNSPDPNGGVMMVQTLNTHASGPTFQSTGTTQLWLKDSNATSNTRLWGFQNSGGALNFLYADDDKTNNFRTPMTMYRGSTGIVINEDSHDQDFRVESNNSTHMLYVNSDQNEVGINTSNPGSTLEVNGNFRPTYYYPHSPTSQTSSNNNNYWKLGNMYLPGPYGAEIVMHGAKPGYSSGGTNVGKLTILLRGGTNASMLDAVFYAEGDNSSVPCQSVRYVPNGNYEFEIYVQLGNYESTSHTVVTGGSWTENVVNTGSTSAPNNSIGIPSQRSTWLGPNEVMTQTQAMTSFNETSHDHDFRVESDANAHMIFVDGAANSIGFGTSSTVGDSQNQTPVIGGYFTTRYGVSSIASANTWTTVHTFANNAGNFMVSMRASGTGNTSHNSVGVAVIQASGATAFDYIRNGGNVQIRMSGLNLQVYQNVFAGANINWGVTNLGP